MRLTIKIMKYRLIKKNQYNPDYLKRCLELFFNNEQFFIEFYFSILIIYKILKSDL